MFDALCFLKLFAFEFAGQETQPSRFPVQISRLGKSSYKIQTSLNAKSARLCFFPGWIKRKRLYHQIGILMYIFVSFAAWFVCFQSIFDMRHTCNDKCNVVWDGWLLFGRITMPTIPACVYFNICTCTYTYIYICIGFDVNSSECIQVSVCAHKAPYECV